MVAADQWNSYQENYMRYSVELAPELPMRKQKASSSAVKATAKEKNAILMLIAIIGVFCIVMILFQACASRINYNVYALNQEINSLSGDIDNLTAEINGYNNLEDLEYRAQNELLMTYPDHEQYVYVENMKGSREVEDYIASLTESQKGVVIRKNPTVVLAAKHLLAQE